MHIFLYAKLKCEDVKALNIISPFTQNNKGDLVCGVNINWI